jgi:hypothetical protein
MIILALIKLDSPNASLRSAFSRKKSKKCPQKIFKYNFQKKIPPKNPPKNFQKKISKKIYQTRLKILSFIKPREKNVQNCLKDFFCNS